MGEELWYVQMNKWGMHIGKRSDDRGYEAESSMATMTLQNKGM